MLGYCGVMTRTDAHRPAVLVTEDYEYVFAEVNELPGAPGWVLRRGDFGLEMARWISRTDRLDRNTHQCHHCGAHLNYFAVLKHVPTGDAVVVGETCLENRFDRASADFHRLRKQAQLDRQAQRVKTAVAAFVEANPDLAFMADPEHQHSNEFVRDVARKLRRYGELSDRQVAAVRRSLEQNAEREVKRAEEQASAAPVVTGKGVTIEGEVVSVKVQESDYGATLKMLVRDDRGFKVWGSVPSSITDSVDKVWGPRLMNGSVRDDGFKGVGVRVRFVANVAASEKDETFGLFRRPRKAEVINESVPV